MSACGMLLIVLVLKDLSIKLGMMSYFLLTKYDVALLFRSGSFEFFKLDFVFNCCGLLTVGYVFVVKLLLLLCCCRYDGRFSF